MQPRTIPGYWLSAPAAPVDQIGCHAGRTGGHAISQVRCGGRPSRMQCGQIPAGGVRSITKRGSWCKSSMLAGAAAVNNGGGPVNSFELTYVSACHGAAIQGLFLGRVCVMNARGIQQPAEIPVSVEEGQSHQIPLRLSPSWNGGLKKEARRRHQLPLLA